MGDPTHFSVKGGANPHTRTRWGTRRRVDRALAIQQWQRLRDALRDLGLRVLVVPPDPDQPGLVYPANAGFMGDVDRPLPRAEKRFYLSNLLPTRAGEKPHYRRALEAAGIRTLEIDPALRFEGEADFFPAGDLFLLTSGRLERQRFVPALALPPWRRVYGFRTDARVEAVLAPIAAPRRILRLELRLEAHYHGDTALCAFGPGRRQLLASRDALAPEAWEPLLREFGERLIELGDEDARRYAANSFTFTPEGGSESFLVLPAGVSERLLAQLRERGVTPICVDVSEFLKKGGGSVKCMIGDLGPVRRGAREKAPVSSPVPASGPLRGRRGPSGAAARAAAPHPPTAAALPDPGAANERPGAPGSLARGSPQDTFITGGDLGGRVQLAPESPGLEVSQRVEASQALQHLGIGGSLPAIRSSQWMATRASLGGARSGR